MQFDHFAAWFFLKFVFSFLFSDFNWQLIPLPRKISDQRPVTPFGLALIFWKKLDSSAVFGQFVFFKNPERGVFGFSTTLFIL